MKAKMKKTIWIAVAALAMASCRPERGCEHVTKNFVGYGTYKAPNKKGVDK